MSSFPTEYMSYMPYESLLSGSTNDNKNNVDDDEKISEWRFMVLNSVLPVRTALGYKNADFRSPTTGCSVIPPKVYFDFYNAIKSIGRKTRWKLYGLFIILYLVCLLAPTVLLATTVFTDDDNDDGDDEANVGENGVVRAHGYKFVGFGISFMIGFGIWHYMSNWIYEVMDTQLYEFVQEHQSNFLKSYGIDVGYRPHTESYPGYMRTIKESSYVWFKKETDPLQDNNEEDIEKTSISTTASFFPPIFMHLYLPGDIYVGEKDYDKSLKYDLDTWTMIQETHKQTTKQPWIGRLLVCVYLPIFFYCYLIEYLMDKLGIGVYWGLFVLYICIVRLAHVWVRNYFLKLYQQIPEEITSKLAETRNKDNENDGVYWKLELKTDELPHRAGAMSTRYELRTGPYDIVS